MAGDETVRVFIEIPKGSRNKYELNQQSGEIELDRRLFAAVSYPTEYGFVKDTIAADGDELRQGPRALPSGAALSRRRLR